MAILSYIKQTKIEEHPVEFRCDICGSVYKIEDEYDIKYHADLRQQMAVLEYYFPSDKGGDCKDEIHCCSTECLTKAIKRIPFNANITIPAFGFYKK